MIKRNNNPIILLSLFAAALLAAGNSYPEAEAAFFANECSGLNHTVSDKMHDAHADLSHKCASIEAALAWEQSYGNLTAEMLMAGVVYE